MPNLKKQLMGFIRNFFEKKRVGFSVYLITLLIMGVALFVRLEIASVDAGLQYVTFFPAVTLCSIMGGYRAGLFATLIGIGLATYIFTPPYYSISLDVIDKSLWSNLVFLFDGIIVSAAIEAMHIYKEKFEHKLELSEKANNIFPFKVLIVTLLPLLVTIGFSAYVIYEMEKNNIESDFKNKNHEALNASTLIFKKQLKSVASKLTLMKNSPHFMSIIDSPTPQNLGKLAKRFSEFAEVSDELLQIRWIDALGKEKVRVDVKNGETIITPLAQLQDKSGRDYFEKTKELPVDEIYLSALDLNIEDGKVEEPYNATFRVAIALFNSKNERQGILILNYHGENFLADVIAAVGNRYNQFLLLNNDGYMLHSPNETEEWGFALDKPNNTLAYSDPEIWAEINAAAEGQILFRGDLWSWQSVYPAIEINKKAKNFNPPLENEYRWIAVIHTDKQELAAELDRFTHKLIVPIIFLTLLSIATSVGAAKSRYQIEKLTNSLIERTQVAEAASLAKANFLANMSHEIRTPMNAILGLVFVLEKGELSNDDKYLLSRIRVAGQSLLRIINDILDLSKIEAGKLELEVSTFKLDEVLDNLATIMAFNATEKNIDLIIRPPFGTSTNGLIGDSLRL